MAFSKRCALLDYKALHIALEVCIQRLVSNKFTDGYKSSSEHAHSEYQPELLGSITDAVGAVTNPSASLQDANLKPSVEGLSRGESSWGIKATTNLQNSLQIRKSASSQNYPAMLLISRSTDQRLVPGKH